MPWQTVLFRSLLFSISEPVSSFGNSFHGFEFTDDCAVHKVGHAWAEDSNIFDSGDYSGNSQSFIESLKRGRMKSATMQHSVI